MIKTFKRLFIPIFFLMLIIVPFQTVYSSALELQPSVNLETVVVSLLPEYKQPSMLVIYDIQLAEDTPLPQELVLQIPVDAELVSISGRNPGGQLDLLEYDLNSIGDWQDIVFTTNSLDIQIEYDDPNLIKQEDVRLFDYQWLSIYSVEVLSLVVRQPFGASEVETQPSMGQKIDGRGGIQYYENTIGRVPAGELFELSLRYVKNTANLSYPALQVMPESPIDESTSGRTPPPESVALWLLAVAFAVLIMVGLYYWWFRVSYSQKSDRITQGVGIMNPEKQAVFCQECGMRSKAGDSYCRNCGTQLRQPTDLEKALNL